MEILHIKFFFDNVKKLLITMVPLERHYNVLGNRNYCFEKKKYHDFLRIISKLRNERSDVYFICERKLIYEYDLLEPL